MWFDLFSSEHELIGNSMQIMKWLIVSLLCFAFNSAIHAVTTVITSIPSSGIVISAPGTYVLGNDITWSPTGAGQAISIVSSDVTLDLKGYTLSSTTTQFNTIGILATQVANVTIKNGTIANLALNGIQCNKCVNVLIKKVTVDGLNLENTATFIIPVGIYTIGCSTVLIDKCTVKNINVLTDSMAAIQLSATLNSTVSNCVVKNLLNRDGACTGIGHLLCDYAVVKSCTLDTIKSEFINNLNTEGHTAIGLIPFISLNLLIEDCKVSNVIGCCDDAHGISVFECINAVVKNCKVDNVLDGAGAAQTGAKATGIEVYANNVEVIDCVVKNIKAINPQDKQATGFSVAQSVGVKFIRCRAENVKVVDQNGKHYPALGYGTGFGWAPDPRILKPAQNVLYKDCVAKKCQLGFDSFFHLDSVWKNIHSDGNEIPVLNDSHDQRTVSCDPCSECGCLQIGCAPAPFAVTILNIAQNNKFEHVQVR